MTYPPRNVREKIFRNVLTERKRQNSLGKPDTMAPERWLTRLVEEVGEVSKAMIEQDPENYEEELVQVAAVAFAMLEDFYKNGLAAKEK